MITRSDVPVLTRTEWAPEPGETVSWFHKYGRVTATFTGDTRRKGKQKIEQCLCIPVDGDRGRWIDRRSLVPSNDQFHLNVRGTWVDIKEAA